MDRQTGIFSSRIIFKFFSILAALAILSSPLHAAVVILVNHTENPVKYSILHADGTQSTATLASGRQKVEPSEEQIGIAFASDKTERRYRLPANTIQVFVGKDKETDLKSFEMTVPPGDEKLPPPKPRIIARTQVKIPVKILADKAQPAVQKIWEKEFRERVAKVSKIFEDDCNVSLDVVAVEMWQSDNAITDFNESLREFEAKVNPSPATLAMGFTSQYQRPDGQTHLGGTRGPLHPYLLVREWSQHVSKNERLEILAHELGHFMGAVHSGAADSLMRPQLGDRLSNLTAFHVDFDPLNTLAMNIFADELRAGPYRGLYRMPIDARRQLQRIYMTLAKELPKDPAAPQYLAMLDLPTDNPQPKPPGKMNLPAATKTVVQAIAEAARINGMAARVYDGDDLAEYYVNRAASAAAKLPPEMAADAFVLGLGIGLNSETWVRNVPSFGTFCREVETNEEFSERLKQLGNPTLRKRHDLLLHFMISAALAAKLGPSVAEQAGFAKEFEDAQGKSGFSFVDLSADFSGIAFAEAVRQKKISLRKLADVFPPQDYLPDFADLQENLPMKELEEKFGLQTDKRFQKEIEKIKTRVKELPGLKPPPDTKR